MPAFSFNYHDHMMRLLRSFVNLLKNTRWERTERRGGGGVPVVQILLQPGSALGYMRNRLFSVKVQKMTALGSQERGV